MIRLATTALCVLAAAPLQAATLNDFTSFYVFGDSLSDDGKLTLPPPSLGGRWTNGLTYAEIVARDFAVSGNLALGGATAEPDNETLYPAEARPLATLGGQVAAFLAADPIATAGSNPLVSILIGANDIFQDAGEADFSIAAIGDSVADAIRSLSAGGPFDDIVLSLLPVPDAAPGFNALASAYNDYLFGLVPGLEAEGINIVVNDLATLTGEIAANPLAYGITQPGACAPRFLPPPPDAGNCTYVGTVDGVPRYDLSLADAYYLVDPVHPSATVHRLWAGQFAAAVAADAGIAPVPLPATGLLLLGGMGALALRRQRRHAG